MGIKSQKALLGVETKIAHSHLNLEEKKWRKEERKTQSCHSGDSEL